jgi:hypothetical protein
VTVFAAIRPHSIDFALLIHVLGAMVLVGAVLTAAGTGVLAWRDDSAVLRRLSYKVLLVVALPAWVVMFVGALWTQSKEHLENASLVWLDIGHAGAEGGGLLLLISIILGGMGVRRSGSGGGSGLVKASSAIAVFLCAVYVVAIWAMGAKPA